MGALGGVGHFAAHLGNDIKDTALGLGPGIVATFEHPIKAGEAMGKSTWQDWSPLFHGHVGQWAHHFYAHPLAPLLDVAAVVGLAAAPFTGGLSTSLDVADASFRDASALGKVGQAVKSSQLLYKTSDGSTLARTLSRGPVARIRQVALHDLATKSEDHLPGWFSPTQRADRMMHRVVQRRAGALSSQIERQVAEHAQVQKFIDAGQKLYNGKDAKAWRSQVLAFNYHQLAANAMREPMDGKPAGFLYVKDLSKAPKPGKVLEHYRAHIPALEEKATKAEAKYFKSPQRLPSHLGGYGAGPVEGRLRAGMSVAKDVQEKLDAALAKKHLAQAKALQSNAEALAQRANVSTAQAFEHELRNLDKKVLTRDKNQAMVDENGTRLIVPRHSARMMGTEGANSANFLGKLITQPWKMLQVGYAPRMVLNTAVGNVFMTMMEHDPLTLTKGVIDAFRQSRDLKALKNIGVHGENYNPAWMEKHFSDVIHAPSTASDIAGPMKGVRGHLRAGLYPLVHHQEQALKRVSINATMRGAGEVKALMKQGKSFDQAASEALSSSRELRDTVAKRAFDTIGDYRTATKAERGIKNIMPFYSWDKHIALHSLSMIDNHPVKLAALGAMGHEGKSEVQKVLGNVPSYVEGVMPLSMIGLAKAPLGIGGTQGPDQTGVVSTRGLNPYATMGDLAGLVQSLTVGGTPNPGENITSGINPVITHAIERIAGKRLGTNVPLTTKGSFVGNVVKDTFQDVPEIKIPMTLLGGTPKPKPNKRTGEVTPFLYSKDPKTQVASLLGIPIKEMNVKRANALAVEEQTGKKPRSTRKSSRSVGIFG